MKIFTVHSKKSKNITDNLILVEEGFSPYAFICNIFWVLHKKIWWLLILLMVFNTSLVIIEEQHIISNYYIYLMQFFSSLILGCYGYDFYRIKLKLDGYQMIDIIAAKNIDIAEFNFLKKTEKFLEDNVK